jgi:hypothetical protein
MDQPLQALLARLDCVSGPFQELRDGVRRAIRIADDDPEMALTRVRKVLEFVVREVYERRCQEPPGTRPLENLLSRLVRDGHLSTRLEAYASGVRMLGNVGTHRFGERITPADVHQSLSQLTPILDWYLQSERPDALGREGAASEQAARKPEAARPDSSGLLSLMWEHLDPTLQDAFLLAYNKKLREGAHRISTRDLFQALTRINDDALRTLLEALPEGAVPEPPAGEIPISHHVLEDAPPLSDCVADSLEHFRQAQPLPRKLKAADLFVDIGKHGHGPSVARLREHGVTAEELERQVREHRLPLLRRREGGRARDT